MSASVRTEIATAASTVAGVNVRPYYRSGGRSGDGTLQMTRVEYPNPFGGIAYWEITVLLPVDIEAAQKRAEELIPALTTALADVLPITAVTFATAQNDASPGQPCLVLAGHRALED